MGKWEGTYMNLCWVINAWIDASLDQSKKKKGHDLSKSQQILRIPKLTSKISFSGK
jgi:hypothetical protein